MDDGCGLRTVAGRHLAFGWGALLVYLTGGGLGLEALHAFKVTWYLDVGAEARRFTWTLAHAHGTLLALVNLGFAATVPRLDGWSRRRVGIASGGLRAATVLIPGGFFLGGLGSRGGDPGIGIAAVPVGAGLLFVAVLLTAMAVFRHGARQRPGP